MNSIIISEQNHSLVVDSRLIAEELAIEHKSFLKNIERHRIDTESYFGALIREVSTAEALPGIQNPNAEYFYLLTEDQVLFLMSLSRNSVPVIKCKASLVKAFSAAKKKLQQLEQLKEIQQLEDLTETQLKAIVMFSAVNAKSNNNLDPAQFLKGIDPIFWNTPALACISLMAQQNLKKLEFLQDIVFAQVELEFKDDQLNLTLQKKIFASAVTDCQEQIQSPEFNLAYQKFAKSLPLAFTRSGFEVLTEVKSNG
jgi:phage regulator Rha-like protein